MKRFLLLMIAAAMIPTFANAALTKDDELEIGENVSVNIDGKHDTQGIGAFVIEKSAKGDEMVTLMIEKMIDGVTYNSTEQLNTGNLSNDYASSRVKEMLTKLVQNELPPEYKFDGPSDKWLHVGGSERLLNESDLTRLGITKNSDGNYSITAKNGFLIPAVGESYWTQIVDGADKVYIVKKLKNITAANPNDIIAEVVPIDVTSSIVNAPTSAVRAIVKIKKELIICRNGTTPAVGATEPSTPPTSTNGAGATSSTTKAPNPDTGVSNVLVPLTGLLVGTLSVAYITTKRNKFNQI